DAKLPATSPDDCVSHSFSGGEKPPIIPKIGAVGKRKAYSTIHVGLCLWADEFFIQSFIALSRNLPREIAHHRTFHQLRPKALIAEDVARPFNRVPESVA